MVYGLEKFAEFFEGYESRYVFIGGTACDLVLSERNEDFRATKDLDIVLLTEVLDAEFINRFIEFIQQGKYEHIRKSTSKDQYFRFEQPAPESGYPQMIELFSKRPEYLAAIETHLGSIHVDGALHSLSAILLDDDYYSLLTEGIETIDSLPVLSICYLPVFKMKAWLDLSFRKASGEHVNTSDLLKHKNDVFRLVATFNPSDRIEISERLQADVNDFLRQVALTSNDLRNLKLSGYSAKEILDLVSRVYGLTE